MKFSTEFIAKVSQAADIVQVVSDRGVALKRAGGTYKGLCPFHSEQTPSFNVNAQRGFFHCFGCGVGGDAIKFLILHDKLSFVEAVSELAQRYGIPLETLRGGPGPKESGDDGLKCLAEAADYFHATLMQAAGAPGRDYLKQRSIPTEEWERFQLGFAGKDYQGLHRHLRAMGFEEGLIARAGLVRQSEKGGRPYDFFRERVMFPIRDARGRCIGFGGRSIQPGQQPKYLNTGETPYYRKSHVLYGFHEGADAIRRSRRLLFTEGYLDVVRLHEFGFNEAVATCGTALTSDHLRFARRHADKAILVFDGDEAGRKAALRGCRLFLPFSFETFIVTLPPEEDPDTFLMHQGAEAFELLLQSATPLFEFLVQQTLAKYGSNVQGRTSAVEELLPLLKEMEKEEMRQLTLIHLSEIIGLPQETVRSMYRSLSENLHIPKKDGTLTSLGMNAALGEDRHEKWILQALLTTREWIGFAREHLRAEEWKVPVFRRIYEKLLSLSDDAYQSLQPAHFDALFADLVPTVNQLLVEEVAADTIDLKLCVRRVKERNLEEEFQKKMATASPEEILRVSIEKRKRREALTQFFQR